MRTPFGYYFLCRPAEAETPRIQALREFLVEEAALSAGLGVSRRLAQRLQGDAVDMQAADLVLAFL